MAYGYPPSYRQATEPPDWLELVAPYVPLSEYPRLCLVCRRFHQQFAPRLWNDPLTALGLLKRDDNDPESVRRFMKHVAAASASPETLALVSSLDLRRFSTGTSDFPLYAGGNSLSGALRSLPSMFPRLRCILLDGHLGFEPEALAAPLGSAQPLPSGLEPPLLLSIAQCRVELPASFFASPYLSSLIYLDVSDMPGSLTAALAQRTLSPSTMPCLRILKARGRELDRAAASFLFRAFAGQLWSVDLSCGRLTDAALDDMRPYSFPRQNLSTANQDVDGWLYYYGVQTPTFGQFCFVKESQWSATFSHPHRHLADAPFYHTEDDSRPVCTPRLDGRVKICPDSADEIKALLCGGPWSRRPSLEHVRGLDDCRGHQGITHLYLNDNDISAAALARMVRSSSGQLQHLECDSLSFRFHEAARLSWLSRAKLSGLLGSAHVFRPVFSANLQVLRIHHSLVTQLPSLEMEGLSALASLWVAETHLLPRAQLAYPEAFVPDMNPRLQSLALTRIPRYSTGPLIESLIKFLRLASIQEQEIQNIRSTGRRAPATLLGLRHIRLEFEPDPTDTFGDGPELEFDFDPAAVMDDAAAEFSFFGDSAWTLSGPFPSTGTTTAVQTRLRDPGPSSSRSSGPLQSARLTDSSPPSASLPAEAETCYLPHTWSWNDETITLPIWVGHPRRAGIAATTAATTISAASATTPPTTTTSPDDPAPAVREYARLIRAHPALRADPVPASPCHVAAGVPAGSFIFSAAWDAILAPPLARPGAATSGDGQSSGNLQGNSSSSSHGNAAGSSRSDNVAGARVITHAASPDVPLPTPAQLRGMRDVVAAIKKYRAGTRRAYDEARRTARARARGDDRPAEEFKLGEPHFHWTGKLEVLLEERSGMGTWR